MSHERPFSGEELKTNWAFVHTFSGGSMYGIEMFKDLVGLIFEPEVTDVALMEKIHVGVWFIGYGMLLRHRGSVRTCR